MYGHEIIEFFKDVPLEDAKTLSKTISECVHFDFGKVDDLENFVAPAIDFFELDPSGIMFDDKYLDNLPRLPFDKCMFTVHGHGKKLAFIAEDKFKNKIVSVRLIWFHKHIQGWEPSSGWFPSILGWEVDFMDGKKTPHIIDEMFSDSDKYREDSQRQATSDRSMLDLFKTCVMLLNTKNIVIQKHPAPTKLNKKRIKKGKQPLFTYHTLRLQLPGKRKKSNGKPGTGDNTTRLHLCRGHFKTYTDENPLFGKLTGRYWWQPHARGDKKQGVVMKDYVVETAVA